VTGTRLQSLLHSCTVQVGSARGPEGTGFFVAPGRVLTCAHVVEPLVRSGVQATVTVADGEVLPCTVLRILPESKPSDLDSYPYPDLALLGVETSDHPCVQLDPALPQTGDRLWALGITEVYARAVLGMTPVALRFEGEHLASSEHRLQLSGGQIAPGMSGSPLLNERTGRVCGMISRTRNDELNLGGWAIPVGQHLAIEDSLSEAHTSFHLADPDWRIARQEMFTDIVKRVLRPSFQPVPPNLQNEPPSLPLRPEYGIVPFVGRDAELSGLRDWCLASGSQVHLLTGPGGTGKTRLAAELCRAMSAVGWVAGFLRERLAIEAVRRLSAVDESVLIVVDYAESRVDLIELLEEVDQFEVHGIQLRLLLIARNEGRWRDELTTKSFTTERLLGRAGKTALASLVRDRDSTALAILEAFAAFADALSVQVAQPQVVTHFPEAEVILHAQAAALLSLLELDSSASDSQVESTQPTKSPLLGLLHHEQRYWAANAAAHFTTGPPSLRTQTRAVALASLMGATAESEAVEVASRLPELSDAASERKYEIAHWLRDLYPRPEGEWVGGIQPDLLVAELLEVAFLGASDAADTAFRGLQPDRARRVLSRLQRACYDRPKLQPILRRAIASDLQVMTAAVASLEREISFMLSAELAAAIRSASDDTVIRDSLLDEISNRADVLAEPAAALAERFLSKARREGDLLFTAHYSDQLGNWLSAMGNVDDAIAAAEEAVAIYRDMPQSGSAADVTSRRWPFYEGLAVATLHLANHLWAAGRHEEATDAGFESLQIWKHLSEKDPAHRGGFAASVASFSTQLWDRGWREQSVHYTEWSLSLLVEQAKTGSPDSIARFADALSNAAYRFKEVGRLDDAVLTQRRAAELFSQLAAANPGEFQPRHAEIVHNLGGILVAAGQLEEAFAAHEEAVDIYRPLVDIQFEVRSEKFMQLLDARFACATKLADPIAVIRAAEEFIDFRTMDGFLDVEAVEALATLGAALAQVGQYEQSLFIQKIALAPLRDLAHQEPDRHSAGLCLLLSNTLACHQHFGQGQESVEYAAEMVDILRGQGDEIFQGKRTSTGQTSSAELLYFASLCFLENERYEEALETAEIAVIRHRQANSGSADSSKLLASALGVCGVSLKHLGRMEEYKEVMTEVRNMKDRLLAEDSQ
jgi:tetratricopeptide (TPR) repeat protein